MFSISFQPSFASIPYRIQPGPHLTGLEEVYQAAKPEELMGPELTRRVRAAAEDIRVSIPEAQKEAQQGLGLRISADCLTGVPGAVLNLTKDSARLETPEGNVQELRMKNEDSDYLVALPDGSNLSVGLSGDQARFATLQRSNQTGDCIFATLQESGKDQFELLSFAARSEPGAAAMLNRITTDEDFNLGLASFGLVSSDFGTFNIPGQWGVPPMMGEPLLEGGARVLESQNKLLP